MPAQFIWTFPSATQLRLPAIPDVPAAPAMTSLPVVPAAPAVRATPGQPGPPAASATPGLPSPTAAPAPQPEQGRDACPNCRNRNPPHADGSVMGCGCCAGTCGICWIASAASAVVRGCWFQSLPRGRDGQYLHTIPLLTFGPVHEMQFRGDFTTVLVPSTSIIGLGECVQTSISFCRNDQHQRVVCSRLAQLVPGLSRVVTISAVGTLFFMYIGCAADGKFMCIICTIA